MIKSNLPRTILAVTLLAITALSFFVTASAQKRRRPVKHFSVCGDPRVACKTIVTFEPYNLPFRVPENAVIWDTELFYAIMLKSVSAPNDSCDIFIPEKERLAAQALFPARKVFASRCFEPGDLSYTNTNQNQRFMAVYAGMTLAEANRTLSAVKAAGKFPKANIRRMRAAMNGT